MQKTLIIILNGVVKDKEICGRFINSGDLDSLFFLVSHRDDKVRNLIAMILFEMRREKKNILYLIDYDPFYVIYMEKLNLFLESEGATYFVRPSDNSFLDAKLGLCCCFLKDILLAYVRRHPECGIFDVFFKLLSSCSNRETIIYSLETILSILSSTIF